MLVDRADFPIVARTELRFLVAAPRGACLPFLLWPRLDAVEAFAATSIDQNSIDLEPGLGLYV